MTAATTTTSTNGFTGWVHSAIAWLDARGRAAWITLMVLGFILFWPVGLAILFYMIWSNRMSGFACRRHSARTAPVGPGFTGNAAFDAYKADTLRRLEEEQAQFEGYLQRLREAKDKAEFDAFMEERRKAAAATTAAAPEDQPDN
jgi:hypothetical protein